MTPEAINERVAVLKKLRKEFEKNRSYAKLAPPSEYRDGYLHSLTNAFAIIDEEIRITSQDGDPSIRI